MQWKATRKAGDMKLAGCKIDVQTVDSTVKVITITDGEGGSLRISADYGMSAAVPAPPEMEKRWKVAGNVAGVPVEHLFDNDWDANQAKRTYEDKVRDPEDAKLEVTPIEVPVEF